MRFLRILLGLIALGAAALWLIDLVHGFQGFSCVKTGRTCTSLDLRLQGHVVLWLAPLVFFVCVWLERKVSRNHRSQFQRSTARHEARGQSSPQQAGPLLPGTAPVLAAHLGNGGTKPAAHLGNGGAEPAAPDELVDEEVEFSPRHAAKDSFMTIYDPPPNARPRHAAPEPQPEW